METEYGRLNDGLIKGEITNMFPFNSLSLWRDEPLWMQMRKKNQNCALVSVVGPTNEWEPAGFSSKKWAVTLKQLDETYNHSSAHVVFLKMT